MNYDERDSNPGPNPDMQARIEPELEARMVAWIAGEASAFEMSELERLVAQRPELAHFKREMEAVHGLIAEAVRPDKNPVRLSDGRRAKLLATIGTHAPALPSEQRVVPIRREGSRWSWRAARMYYTIGGLAAACVLVMVQLSPRQKLAERESAKVHALADVQRQRMQKVSDAEGTAELESPERAPARVEARRAFKAIEGTDARVNESAREVDRDGIRPAEESPRVPVALLDQARITLDSKPDERPPVLFSNTPNESFVGGALAPGGAGGSSLSSDKSTVATFGEVARASKPMVDRSSVTGSVTLGAQVNGGASADSFAASAVGKDRVGASANDVAGFSFRDQPQPLQLGASASAAPAAAAPAPVSRFGSTLDTPATLNRSAESTPPADAVSVAAGTSAVNGGRTEPSSSTGDVITLDAFTVSAPKKQERKDAGAGRGAADDARNATRELAGAKVARLKEEQEKKGDYSAINPATPTDANAEMNASTESVSTFSLHVSDVSFRLAVAAAAAFERGEESKDIEIRAEEFYNAFDYGDPAPAMAEKVGARIEQSAHPVLQQRNLLRIAMKVPATGRGAGQPLRLTVLLDTSGSMEREDRRLAVRRALEELIALLGANDRITLIGFARQPRLLAEAVPGHQAGHLVELSARTPAEGGTNLEEALKLARQLAVRHRVDAAQNRIVLLTDGAANLGNADPAGLATTVEALRQQGIAFDACGIGLEGVGDNVLEALTRKGDGRYYVIDRPEAADVAFARQLAGAFRPAAENVKLQVRFNPSRVGNYRLIGFEQHRLREEDFRNDQVDAAELAAEEAATALYQIEVLPQGSGEIGEVYVRFRDAATGAMVERSWTIRHDPQAPRFDRASPSLQLAGVAALLAEKLNDTPLADQFKLGDFAAVVNTVRTHYAQEPRVQELAVLYGRLRRMSGE